MMRLGIVLLSVLGMVFLQAGQSAQAVELPLGDYVQFVVHDKKPIISFCSLAVHEGKTVNIENKGIKTEVIKKPDALIISILTTTNKGVLVEQIALTANADDYISGTASQIFNGKAVGTWPIYLKQLPAPQTAASK